MAVGVRAMKPLFWFAVTRKLLELVWTATGLLSAPLGDGLVALVALVACGGVLFPAITATHYWIRNHNYLVHNNTSTVFRCVAIFESSGSFFCFV